MTGAAIDTRAPVAKLASLPGVSTASGVAAAAEHAHVTGRVLPVAAALRDLLPSAGLRRGSTVAVHGASSLLLALLAEATANGSWAAAVGMPDLGLVAAQELGVEVGRFALVPHPGVEFAPVVAALLDGLDLVAVDPAGRLAPQVARRLSARARHRGAVLLSCGAWPGAEVELHCAAGRWTGLESGYGYLGTRRVTVHAGGRGAAARPVRAELLLPGPAGVVARGAPDTPAVRSAERAGPLPAEEAG
ncbi:hypothetical protein [Amycolatopsis anabasis]|uniref:hypothetical protein n=1 Tax=Amycolatopsis anabasis TaxID=1840409 RepID=UPI0015D241C2|nr:hypothetical protein [Amycolatopsis anabasis]